VSDDIDSITARVTKSIADEADTARADFTRLMTGHLQSMEAGQSHVFGLGSVKVDIILRRHEADTFVMVPDYDDEYGFGGGLGLQNVSEAADHFHWAYPVICGQYNLRMAALNDMGEWKAANVFRHLAADDPSFYPAMMLEFARLRARRHRRLLAAEGSFMASQWASVTGRNPRDTRARLAFETALFDAMWASYGPTDSHYLGGKRLIKETHLARTELLHLPPELWSEARLVSEASGRVGGIDQASRDKAIGMWCDATAMFSRGFTA